MRSEESTETSMAALPDDEWDNGGAVPRARQHPLPWILFAVTLVSLGAIGVLLAMRVKDQSARADVELVKRTRAEEALKAAESARDEATSHVAQLGKSAQRSGRCARCGAQDL